MSYQMNISNPYSTYPYLNGTAAGQASAPSSSTWSKSLPFATVTPYTSSSLPQAYMGSNISSAIMQTLQMFCMLIQQILPAILGTSPNSPKSDPSVETPYESSSHVSPYSGGGYSSVAPDAGQFQYNPYRAGSLGSYGPSVSQKQPVSRNSDYSGTDATQETNLPPIDSKGAPSNGSGHPIPGAVSNDTEWHNNVNVYCSSTKDQETWGDQNSGYITELDKGLDAGKTLRDAHDSIHLNTPEAQTPIRNNANENSLVQGKGGKALLITGDGINRAEADVFAEHLRKDEGMEVTVLADATPRQVKEALQKMGQTKGGQCLVGISAHGAHDDNANGTMALGKGDGDANQWLHESDLKSWINQYVSPSYGNVNVVLDSCYSGNFVQ